MQIALPKFIESIVDRRIQLAKTGVDMSYFTPQYLLQSQVWEQYKKGAMWAITRIFTDKDAKRICKHRHGTNPTIIHQSHRAEYDGYFWCGVRYAACRAVEYFEVLKHDVSKNYNDLFFNQLKQYINSEITVEEFMI